MASRKIEDLHPKLQPLALAFKRACRDRGVDVLIYMTYRSCQEQNDLYQQGRTQKGRIVTNARGGKSSHNFTIDGKPASLAFDAVPIIQKSCVWDDDFLWDRMGEAADEVGLKWGGRWKSFKDKPHFYIEP